MPRRRRCLDRTSTHPGDRRPGGGRFLALAANAGPAAARNAGLGQVTTPLVAFVDSDCVPDPHWLEPLLGHFDDPMVAAVAPRIVPLPVVPDHGSLSLRSRALLVGPGRLRRAGPTAEPDPLRAERGAPGPPGGSRRSAVRPPAAGWRGRRSGLAPRRGRMGRAVRTGVRRCSMTARCIWVPGWVAGPSTARPPDLWPAVTRRRSCRSRPPPGRPACGPWPAPAGPSWRPGSWPHPSACWHDRFDGLVEKPFGVATKIAAGGTLRSAAARAARPHPGLVPRPGTRLVLAPYPARRRRWPSSLPRSATGGPTGPSSIRCGTPHCTWPTTSPTAQASGGAA